MDRTRRTCLQPERHTGRLRRLSKTRQFAHDLVVKALRGRFERRWDRNPRKEHKRRRNDIRVQHRDFRIVPTCKSDCVLKGMSRELREIDGAENPFQLDHSAPTFGEFLRERKLMMCTSTVACCRLAFYRLLRVAEWVDAGKDTALMARWQVTVVSLVVPRVILRASVSVLTGRTPAHEGRR